MGLIEEGESPYETAKRELHEETGYSSKSIEQVGVIFLAPALMNTRGFVFYANNLEKEDTSNPDKQEGNLNLVQIDNQTLEEMLERNQIKDTSTLTALFLTQGQIYKS